MSIFAAQIRAARGLLQISQIELSAESGLGLQTIKNLEKDDAAIGKASNNTVKKIRECLENKGIKFTFIKEDGQISEAGVKLAISLMNKKS